MDPKLGSRAAHIMVLDPLRKFSGSTTPSPFQSSALPQAAWQVASGSTFSGSCGSRGRAGGREAQQASGAAASRRRARSASQLQACLSQRCVGGPASRARLNPAGPSRGAPGPHHLQRLSQVFALRVGGAPAHD